VNRKDDIVLYLGYELFLKKAVIIKRVCCKIPEKRKNIEKEFNEKKEFPIIDVFVEDEYIFIISEICIFFLKKDLKLPEKV
jgi:hypothetical protein